MASAAGGIDGALARAAAAETIDRLFRAQVAAHGARVALQHGERRWTYAQVAERVNRLAHALAARGIGRGDRVAILSENRPEYIELDLAAATLGAVCACQNWRQAPAELAHCLRLTEPRLALVSERHAPTLAAIDHGIPGVLTLGQEYERALAAASAAAPPEVAEPEDGLVILYTSGTTGFPRGALISHRAMVARAIIGLIDRPLAPDDAFVAWPPLYHMGATDAAFATLTRGGTVIVTDGFDVGAIVATAARETLGWLHVMPGTVDRLLAEVRRTGLRPRRLRFVGVMADLVPRARIAEVTTLLGAPYVNTFGSTETGGVASKGVIPVGVVPERLSKVQSSLCHVRLVDERDREVPDGEPGEMIVRSPGLFSGYWGATDVNAEVFRGGWFHTGDVFVRNPDATLDFVDRRTYLIKSGGENIYPAEIERLLLASPRVAEAVVVRRPDAQWGEVPVAVVVARDPALTADDVLAACRGRIAGYKLPRDVRFVRDADLPRSASGKIVRHEVEALLGDGEAPTGFPSG
jgi:fatty-acyl-CoA synthase